MANDSEDKDVENKRNNPKPDRPLRSKFIRYGAIAGILGTLFAALQPWAIEKGISSQIKVDPSNPGYMFWEHLPLPIISKFYLFNIENPNEFLKGDKLRVREIGPFTMSQTRWKEIIEFSDKTVKYYEWRNYTILDEQTKGSWDQEITVLNPLVASIGSIIGDKLEQLIPIPLAVSPFVYSTVSAVLLVHSQNFFLKTTPRKLIIGQRFNLLDTVTTLVRPLELLGVKASDLIPTDDLPNNTFGLINGKNYTRMGPWEVYTGVDVPKELYTYAVGFKGERLMKRWAGPECNTPKGTDGLQFQPLINRTQKLTIFAGDIYRSLDMTYVEDVDYFGIQTFKYIIAPEMFQPPSVNPDNACYCVHTGKKKSRCEYFGLLDLTGGFSGSPFVVTKPHFLDAPEIQKQVDGLSPDPDKHTFYMLIKPDIGLPISVKGRLQFNLRVEKLPFLRGFNNIRDTIVPLGWLEEGADLDGLLYYVMRGGLVLAPKVTSAGFYAAAIGGWAAFLAGLIYSGLRKCCKGKIESSDKFFVSRGSPSQEELIGDESKLFMNQSRLPNQQPIVRAPEPFDNEQPSESQNGLMLVNSLRPFPIRTNAISIIPVDSNMFQPTSCVQLYRFPTALNQDEPFDQLLLPITNSNQESNRLESGMVTWNERTSKSVKERNLKGKEKVTRGRSLPLNPKTRQRSKRIQVDSKETQGRFVQVDRDIKGFRYAGIDAIMKSYSGFRRDSIEDEMNVVKGQEMVKKRVNTYENVKHNSYNSSSREDSSEVTNDANAFDESDQVKVDGLFSESKMTGDLIGAEVLYEQVHGESDTNNLKTNMETGIQSHGSIKNLNHLAGHSLDEYVERNENSNKSPIDKNISIKSNSFQSESGLSSKSSLSRNQSMDHENEDGIYESDSTTESRTTTSEISEMSLTRQKVKSNHETKAFGLPGIENPERLETPSFSDEFSIGFDTSRASTPNSLNKNQKSRKEKNSCILS